MNSGSHCFEFSGFRLDTRRRELIDPKGRTVRLSAKAYDTLVYLVEHAGELVERGTLLNAVWPGVVVEDNNLNQAIAALRRALGDDTIVTVARRGYQFVAEVNRVPTTDRRPAEERRRSKLERCGPIAALLLLIAAGASTWILLQLTSESPIPPKIAVLPCENLSADSGHAYLADGTHEEILNQLAKLSGLLVVARSSVLQFAGERPPIPEIARMLDASAVMECSVRVAGDGMLITAQLIDPATNSHLWSETYPGDLRDLDALFAMQADIAASIAEALNATLLPAERRRIKTLPTQSYEAYASFLEASSAMTSALMTNPFSERPVELLDAAIAEDPAFAVAYAARAEFRIYRIEAAWQYPRSPFSVADELEAARADAERALELDRELPKAWVALAVIDRFNGDRDMAVDRLARAEALDPDRPGVLIVRAMFALMDNRRTQALAILRRLEALDPMGFNGELLLIAGDIDGAVEWLRRFTDDAPSRAGGQILLGLGQALTGEGEAAEASLRLGEALLPATLTLPDGSPNPLWVNRLMPGLIYAYGRLGLEADAQRVFDRLTEAAPDERDRASVAWMIVHLGLGEVDRAWEYAVAAADEPLPPWVTIQYHFLLNTLDDPVLERADFLELRKKLGFIE